MLAQFKRFILRSGTNAYTKATELCSDVLE